MLTLVLGLLAAAGALLAARMSAGTRAPTPHGPVAAPVTAPVRPGPLPMPAAPETPTAPAITLPPDPPERRHTACDGRTYADGEAMPKCGRG